MQRRTVKPRGSEGQRGLGATQTAGDVARMTSSGGNHMVKQNWLNPSLRNFPVPSTCPATHTQERKCGRPFSSVRLLSATIVESGFRHTTLSNCASTTPGRAALQQQMTRKPSAEGAAVCPATSAQPRVPSHAPSCVHQTKTKAEARKRVNVTERSTPRLRDGGTDRGRKLMRCLLETTRC